MLAPLVKEDSAPAGEYRATCPYRKCYPARTPLKSATFKKTKLRPGDQNVECSIVTLRSKPLDGVFAYHTREMKCIFIIGILFALGTGTLTAQSQKTDAKSPKEVVEQFVKMETEGGRLTPDGWREASAYFVHPSPFTPDAKVVLIGKSYSVWDPMKMPSGTTTVSVEINLLGQLDSALRFTPPTRRFYKNSRYFNLILTDRHLELGGKGEKSKEVTGPERWMIDGPSDTLMLNIVTAIRYVSEARDKATNPSMKKNADSTLIRLKSLL
jgi:hypothetical protein